MPEFDPKTVDLMETMLVLAGLLVLVAVGIQVITVSRRRAKGRAGDPDAELAESFREAFEAGEMSVEEYHRVRAALDRGPAAPAPRIAPAPTLPASPVAADTPGGPESADPEEPSSGPGRPAFDAASFVEPWQAIATPAQADGLATELRRELSPGHPLHDLPLRAVARRLDGDDVLFLVDDGSGRVASVRLTWRGAPEAPPLPASGLHADLGAWAEAERRPDA